MPLCEHSFGSECPNHGTVKGCEPNPDVAVYTRREVRYALMAADIAGWQRGRRREPNPGRDVIVRSALVIGVRAAQADAHA